MSLEKTLFIIKPESFDERDEIKEYILKHSGFRIVDSLIIRLNDRDVECLYRDDIETDLLQATKDHLSGHLVEACLIEGENVIDRFINLAGTHYIGSLCKPHTIRFLFRKNEVKNYGGVIYYLNAIHKASKTEVNSALEWFLGKKKGLVRVSSYQAPKLKDPPPS